MFLVFVYVNDCKMYAVFVFRYGVWSKEARSLGLPSYAPTFVFMSVIPLEIMHEYLRLRLETRPQTPNPLSLEQVIPLSIVNVFLEVLFSVVFVINICKGFEN